VRDATTHSSSESADTTGELPLLGRARELADLRAALEGSAAGSGELVLLTGEPGIGKTRLATALGELATADGHRVAWARGWDGGGAPAFWPWVQIVRAVAADRNDEELLGDLGAGARWVAQLAPELRERLDLPEAGDLESEQARFSLFDAVTIFLRNAAQREPLVILLDDLHTADLSSLLLLAFLARSLNETRVLTVTTHHDAGPRRGAEVEAVFGELARFGRRIDLIGLEDDDLRALVIHRSGADPSEELVHSLRALTEGNPFYSDEVVRLLVAQGRLDRPVGDRGPVLPDSVRDAIRRRLLPLRAEVLETLEAAAVQGRDFDLTTLERVAGLPRPELLELLDEAMALQLVEEAPGPAGSFRFAHGLIRETFYGNLTATRRARLHAAVGDALERTAASEAELAHHFVEAARVGDPGKALDHAERAGHEALAALAYERAADLFDAALAALDMIGEPDDRRRGELLLLRGQAQMQAGGDAARATLIAAIDLARRVGDSDLLARAALSLGGFGLSPGMVDDVLVAVLEEALEGIGPDGGALRARLLVRLAVALYYSNAVDRREALVQEALDIARELSDPPTLAYVLDQGHIATSGPYTTERGLAWAHELFALADDVGDPELAVRAHSWQIDLLLELDDLPGADMAIEALDRIATDSRDPRARAYIPLHRARRAMISGRLEDTEQLIHEGIALGWSLQDSTVPILAGAQLFWLRMGQGRLRELEDAVRQFADQLPAMPAWRVALATVYLHTGRPAQARREYDRLAEHDFSAIPHDNVWSVAIALLAELSETFRDAERARVLEDLLLPLADRNVVTPTGIFAGPVMRYLALTAAARGDNDLALERLPAAREACDRMDYVPMLAVIDVDEARWRARRNAPGDVDKARELLKRGLARAEDVGVPRMDERLARAAALLPSEESDAPAPPAPQDGAATAVLAREGDVWRLDYEGRVLRVRDAKGMRHLALLLANPGVEFHAVDVATAAEGGAAAGPKEAEGLSVRAGTGDAGPALDSRAKAEYRSRLEDLRAEIEEAESFNDPERAARAREEMDFIAHELSAAVGLGGRDRVASSAAERARVNVTRALRREIRRIADEHASLGRELETTVRTGTFCAYEPDPRRPVAWDVDAG
jgi:tetratricopeptide (TPR) repeat protein